MTARKAPSPFVKDADWEDADWEDVAVDRLADERLFEGVRGRRVVAFLIDLAVVGLLIFVLWAVAIGPVLLTFGPLLMLATALLPFAYHTLCIGGPWHGTLGMRVMGLTVISTDGKSPAYPQAAIQTAIFMVTAALTQFLVVLVACFNDQGRCLHDYLAGTLVVNRWALSPGPAD